MVLLELRPGTKSTHAMGQLSPHTTTAKASMATVRGSGAGTLGVPLEGTRRVGELLVFPSGCEGKLGVALESLQGLRDLT